MSAPPYMRFYPGDYDRDTAHLRGPAEHGAYFLLIKAMWNAGGRLPADDKKLARIAQCSDKEWLALREVILPFFKRRGGIIRHNRITAELAKCARTSVQASEAGKASASKKRRKNNTKPATDVQQKSNHSDSDSEGSRGLIDSPPTTFRTEADARPEGASPPALRVVEKEPVEVRKAAVESVRRGLPKIVRDPPSETPAEMAERLRKAMA